MQKHSLLALHEVEALNYSHLMWLIFIFPPMSWNTIVFFFFYKTHAGTLKRGSRLLMLKWSCFKSSWCSRRDENTTDHWLGTESHVGVAFPELVGTLCLQRNVDIDGRSVCVHLFVHMRENRNISRHICDTRLFEQERKKGKQGHSLLLAAMAWWTRSYYTSWICEENRWTSWVE